MKIAWVLIFFAGSSPVVVPYPYSTKEACVAALDEATGNQSRAGSYVCLQVETEK